MTDTLTIGGVEGLRIAPGTETLHRRIVAEVEASRDAVLCALQHTAWTAEANKLCKEYMAASFIHAETLLAPMKKAEEQHQLWLRAYENVTRG